MKVKHSQRGFTLVEMMIAVAIIGIIAALAIPAYRSYLNTANMTKVTSNFEEAVSAARNTFQKDETLLALDLSASAPTNTSEWLVLFNSADVLAPGGGPAYISSTNKKDSGRGDATTGAIGVKWNPSKSGKKGVTEARLELWRPLYLSLTEQHARVSKEEFEVVIQRQP